MTLTGQVLRAWSYLAKLLNILHEENICNNMLVQAFLKHEIRGIQLNQPSGIEMH